MSNVIVTGKGPPKKRPRGNDVAGIEEKDVPVTFCCAKCNHTGGINIDYICDTCKVQFCIECETIGLWDICNRCQVIICDDCETLTQCFLVGKCQLTSFINKQVTF
jgi:hypothetical protein